MHEMLDGGANVHDAHQVHSVYLYVRKQIFACAHAIVLRIGPLLQLFCRVGAPDRGKGVFTAVADARVCSADARRRIHLSTPA